MQYIRFPFDALRTSAHAMPARRLRRSLLALTLLPMAACSAGHGGASGSGSAAEVGTLHYSGDYSGTIAFKDSDCVVIDGHLMALNAPRWKNGVPASQGTQIGVTLEKNGAPTEFNFQLDEGAAQNTFATTNQARPIQGIHVRKADGSWEVVFDGFRVAGTNWLQTMDSSKTKWVTLKGELHCTHVK
ncbi:hypothetical protein HNQ86_001906 [Oleiagrimonas soli]|nr:hypothetical protein [Oleiagrimonas soli]